MEKSKKIGEVRERLDKSLASPDLVNINSIRSLVKSQLRRSGLEGLKVVKKKKKKLLSFKIFYLSTSMECLLVAWLNWQDAFSGQSNTSNLDSLSYACTQLHLSN